MANEENPKHSTSDIWDRLNQQSDSITELARVSAASEANIAALATAVENGFTSINKSVARIADSQNCPTNWIGLGSMLFVVLGALITFVALQTDPVRVIAAENAEDFRDLHQRELEYAREMGATEARLTNLEKGEHNGRNYTR